MMVHTFDPSTREVEAGRSVFVQSQPGLSSMFQDEKLCLEKKDLEDARCRKVFHEISLVEVRIELLKVCEH